MHSCLNELARLHDRLIDAALDAAGRGRLRAVLGDPVGRARFAQLMCLDADLCELHRPGLPVAGGCRVAAAHAEVG